MSTEWNAAEYHRLSEPQLAWGLRVLASVPLSGDERVLDAGCGTGRVTAALAARVPRGRVIGLDRSRRMLEEARGVLAPFGAPLVCAALPHVPLAGAVDVVFSTATFHWVHDHPALFQALATALVPGGRLVAQCGGGANLARVHARAETLMQASPYAAAFAAWTPPWEFADAETTRQRLADAGFTDIETSVEAAPTSLRDAAQYHAFLTTVIFRDHLRYLPDEKTRHAFVAELTRQAAADDEPFLLDYWRLNLRARRPSTGPAT